MKKLILVRHGTDEGGFNAHLSLTGKRQITDLAGKLAPHVDGNSVLMFSSTALRAQDGAKILSKAISVSFELCDTLWSGYDGKVLGCVPDFEQVMKLVSSHPNQADVVILITHYEYVEDFPQFFGKKYLGVDFPSKVIPKGTAWLVDCETKQVTHIC